MDTNSDHPENLNALERRLSAWQPNREGLDTDAMLFAAGRASMQLGRARFAWPALTMLLTAVSVVLGLWLANERDERLVLAAQLQESQSVPTVNPTPPPDSDTVPTESLPGRALAEKTPRPDELSPNSYLASRRALEKGLDAWPSRMEVHGGSPDPSTESPVLRLGQRDALLEP
ncbi:MAG TPA: hypothetical protein VH592_25785 [Gemmataceae bacterium]|jgi:hypothetical protein